MEAPLPAATAVMIGRALLAVIFLLALGACRGAPSEPQTPTSAAGVSALPADVVLFVEWWETLDGVGDGCPQEMLTGTDYVLNAGRLQATNVSGRVEPVVGFLGAGQSRTGALGSGASGLLYAMPALPYTHDGVTVQSIDAGGVLIATVDGLSVRLGPGERWQEEQPYEPAPGCSGLRVRSLTNHGTLPAGQVDVAP